jgi:hypothetical protein
VRKCGTVISRGKELIRKDKVRVTRNLEETDVIRV